MKRKITFLLAALLLMSGLTWAQQITWSAADQGYENSQVIESVDFDDYVSATFDKGTNNNAPKYYTTGAAIRCYGGNYFTVSSDYLLTEIVFGFGSGEGSNAITADCGAYANGTWTGSANSVTFTIGGTSGHRRFATFTISYTESGTPAPTITVENNDELVYNATSGSFNFTVDNPVSGGSMTVSTEEEWISNPTIAGSAVNFTTTINQSGAPREGIITLAYTYGEQTITKPVTVIQAGNPNIVDHISDITAAGNYSVQGTIVAINNRGFIVGDGTGYVYYYFGNNFEYGDYDLGDMVKLSGPVVVYGNSKVYEFDSSTTISYVTESNYVAEDPVVLSGADMDAQVASSSTDQLSSYVQYEGTFSINGTHYNITNIAGAQTAKGSISYPIDTTGFSSLDGKKVVVTGYYVGVSSSQYYNTMIGSVVESTEPVITLTPNEINVGSEGGRFGVAVTLSNITFGANPGFNIPVWDEFYEWIHFEEVNLQELDSICFTLDPNTTDTLRSFYFELRIIPDLTHPSQVYSNRVTVTQEAYVAPTYAELPFEFDGGKADIESTDGLYQEGLDSDYSSSPKLKFNTAGDYVLLQFQEVPGTLTFDIKGNGSGSNPWEGEFKLMVSNDGSTFVEKAVYETGDLTSTKTTMTIDDLASEVRYIKWIYTTKTLGNVALGNIHLYEFGGGPVTEYDLTIEPFENLEIFTFVGGDENNPFEGAGTIQVTVGDQVMLSITANEGYEIQSLMVDGVEHVNDITDDATYTFTMPDHNVTISATAVEEVPPTPFEPATYTLVTSDDQIVDGKSYIIVGSKEIEGETHYYAMGEQRNNNRGGVAISVDGNTATVETADVHEFVISDVGFPVEEWEDLRDGGGTWQAPSFYSIYDNTDNSGYLYAASSTANQLKTEAELDNNNGLWEIYIDTVAHIVASGSSNRNVMQFNYNNNNPTIFSCYAEANQSPVYLYVKDEATTTITQTIELVAGTNWVSFNVDITLDDLKDALLTAVTTSNPTITIKSQSQNVKYQRGRWAGQLATLDMALMYKITVPEACEISLEGMPVDPSELTVNINANGSTWIAFPFNESMTVTNFFGSFPVNNDQAKSQGQNTKYNRGRWAGALTTLEPGKGYIYVSADDNVRTFTFPTITKTAQ